MRSDNLRLRCVHPPTSSHNLQLLLGHHGRHGHGGRGGPGGPGGQGGHGGHGQDTTGQN